MKYELVIGLEMHCELKSNSKVFSPAANIYIKKANYNVNEVCLALPGTLPSLNYKSVKDAIKMALILNCKIPKYMLFDRKNYYYPDLPKGYQITQNTSPVGVNGNIDIMVNGKKKNITIQDIHLEEDTASLDHLDTISLLDYNRAGVPLLECVTDPCISSADEAVAFIETMVRIYQYTGISDADTKKGEIRCDVNISLKDDNGNFVTPRVEVKNVNSISNVRNTINYEEERLKKALKDNTPLYQETRRYDEGLNETVFMRSKKDAIDYKYFVEPNIPPFEITDTLIKEIKNDIPVLADERKENYLNNLKLDEKNASILVKNIETASYFEDCVKIGIKPKEASNWINGMISAYLYKENISINDFYLKPMYLKQIFDAMSDNTISSKQAKEVFNKALENKKEPKEFISKENAQITDDNLIESIIDNILDNSENQIKEYHSGRTNIFDYFVGQVMKETKGKANPTLTKEILNKKLEKLR